MLARRSIAFAFPVYTAGLLLGILRAIETDPPGWWVDPRVMLSGVVWLIFGAYLVLALPQRVSARTTAWVAIAGSVVVIVRCDRGAHRAGGLPRLRSVGESLWPTTPSRTTPCSST